MKAIRRLHSNPPEASAAHEAAERIAIAALAFLGSEPERLNRFLALTGLSPAHLRAAAAGPGFLAGVLDHVLADETLLTAFAASEGLDPAKVAAARGRLTPPDPP